MTKITMSDGQFVERGTRDLWNDTMQEQRNRIRALTTEREALATVETERDQLLKLLEAIIDEYNGHMYGPTMHAIEAARSELDKANGT